MVIRTTECMLRLYNTDYEYRDLTIHQMFYETVSSLGVLGTAQQLVVRRRQVRVTSLQPLNLPLLASHKLQRG